ncbi:MAG TPA: hypothetical protein VF281_02170 [Candidatus Saccharimonadales bacterium]
MLTLSEQHILQHFRDSYEELAEISNKNTKNYNLNKIAAILRQFLLDRNQLISDVRRILSANQLHTSTISYPCQPYIAPQIPNLQFGGAYDGFEIPNAIPSFSSNLFLNISVGTVIDTVITVKDLVKYVANKDGAIHYDQKKLEGNDLLLQQLQYEFIVGGNSALSKMLPPVGRVVLNGLREVYDRTVELLEA